MGFIEVVVGGFSLKWEFAWGVLILFSPFW